MVYRYLMAGLLIMGLVSGLAEAGETKIAFVDVKTAIENSKVYQAGKKRLKTLLLRRQKELNELKKKIRKSEEDLLSQSMAMSPERLSQKQEELAELRKSFTRKQQDARDEIAREKKRLDQGIVPDFLAAVKKFGKKNGYALILQSGSIIYGAPSHDVTAEITKLLDQKK